MNSSLARLLAAVATMAPMTALGAAPQITIDSGVVAGSAVETVESFKGIPYAEPQGMPYFLSLAYRVERFILSRVSAPLGPRTRPSVRSMMWRR